MATAPVTPSAATTGTRSRIRSLDMRLACLQIAAGTIRLFLIRGDSSQPWVSCECRRLLSKLLHQAQLAHWGPAEVRLAARSVGTIACPRVDGQRALVLLVGEEERVIAARRAESVVGGAQEHAPDAAARMSRIDEEEKHLSILGVDSGVADYPIGLVRRDEQHVRRRVVGDQLVPVVR